MKPQGLAGYADPVNAGPANLGLLDTSAIKRYLGLFYAATGYVLAIAYWPVFILFIGNVPRVEDRLIEPTVSAATTIVPTWQALAIDVALLAAFALHHSFLARPAVKQVWGRFVSSPFQRATFTQIANVFAFAIIIFWQPIPIVLWKFDPHSAVLRLLIVPLWQLGWVLLLIGATSFKLSALFGLRQVWFWFKGKPYEPVDITSSRTYRLARHPEFLGVFLLIWITADMTVGHFLLASTFTLYSFVALQIRDRELLKRFGEKQQAYQAEVPMLGPRWAVVTLFSLWLAITGIQLVHTMHQWRDDAQARADLQRLRQALMNYRERTGAFPSLISNGTFPFQQWHHFKSCEQEVFRERYNNVMAALMSSGALQTPLVHPNRRAKDLGYCFSNYRDTGKDTWVLWTSLDAGASSNSGETATCRPFDHSVGQFGHCERDRASQDYCLCLQ